MSLEDRMKEINRAYVQRSLRIGGSRYIGMGMNEETYITPSKNLGVAIGGARKSLNLTPEEKKERARLASEKFKNKKKGNLVSNEEVNEPVSEGEEPEGKHITKQIYKNKHNKRIEVIQTIDVKTMDDKPRKGKKTFNGGKKGIKKGGYSWEQFLDDTDEAVTTAGRIGHSFLGLGKKGKKGKKGGRAFTENKEITKEPIQNLTIQHLRDKKQDIYSPDGVMFSQYTPPEQMRDQSIRPDMPIDETEVVKPPPHLTQWQMFKKGISIIPHLIGALVGGAEEETKEGGKKKRVYKKKMEGGNTIGDWKRYFDGNISPEKKVIMDAKLKKMNDFEGLPTILPPLKEKSSVVGAGKKKPSKWVEFVKAYSKKHNIKYNEALKDSKCKSEYYNSK